MRRKLIKQGENSLTLTMPARWLQLQDLQAGDEVGISWEQNKLIIFPSDHDTKMKEFLLEIPLASQAQTGSSILADSMIVAYTAGFDKIVLTYKGDPKPLFDIVNTRLIGFEIVESESDKYVIESVSESQCDNFTKILLRSFYIIKEMLRDLQNPLVTEYHNTIVKYWLFLQRCAAKNVFIHEAGQFYSKFFDSLAEAGNGCYRLHEYIQNGTISVPLPEAELHHAAIELLESMQHAYHKSDISLLHTQQQKGHSFLHEEPGKCLNSKDTFLNTHLLLVYMPLVRATSQLLGIILLNQEGKNGTT